MSRETDREANGTGDYRARFEQLQAEFIDEPRQAVKSAQSLVEEAIDRMMEGLRHSGVDDKADTEQLRLTMKRYRDLLYQLTDEQHVPHSPENARVDEAQAAHSPENAAAAAPPPQPSPEGRASEARPPA